MRMITNRSKMGRNSLITVIFLLLLIGLRIIWMDGFDIQQIETLEQGVLKLDKMEENFKVKLNGEWTFYPNTYIFANDHMNVKKKVRDYFTVPSEWDKYFTGEQVQHGSYVLKIVTNDVNQKLYGITIPESLSAYEVYVNGNLIGRVGDLTKMQSSFGISTRPETYYFSLNSLENELIIQGAHANPFTIGGLSKSIVFGDLQSIEKMKLFSVITQIAVCSILILYFIYTILLLIIGFRDKSLFYFLSLTLMTAFTILISHDKLLYTVLPYSWVLSDKLFFLSYFLAITLFTLYIQALVENYFKLKTAWLLNSLFITYFLFLLLAPIKIIYKSLVIFNFFYLAFPIFVIVLIIIIVAKGHTNVLFLMLTATAVASNSITITLNQNSDFPIYYPFDLLIAVTAVSAHWFFLHFQTTHEAKKLSEKLQQEIIRKDDFLTNTSHEIRNPLHGIINIAHSLYEKEGANLQKENKENLQRLMTISDHMLFMLNDLLDMVKLREKTLKLNKRPTNIQSVVTGVGDMFYFMLQGKPLELHISIPTDLPLVMADENRLIQVVSNLIHNAIKFTEQGLITVDATVQENMVAIAIADSGIGIDKRMQQDIFEPYEQIESNITSMSGGLGLGLSICREIITLHGGEIYVSSELGKGSTFTFTLPVAILTKSENNQEIVEDTIIYGVDISHSMSKSVTENDNDHILTASNAKILLVDDDAINLQVLVNALSTEAYEIDTALNGVEALKKIQEKTFDLIVSDIMMPRMSGYELARRIRETFSIGELPILFLTARHTREDIIRAFQVGANDYVTKPTEYVELKGRVNALIRMKKFSEEKLRLEAAWLQAQINPHFFFNILNSIYILSDVDERKMKELIEAFSDYLQTSFDFENIELLVPIDYELSLVRSYLAIEQIRFDERVKVVWDIDDNLQFKIPPLSIQTIVENAIKHGLLTKAEGGTISIKVDEHVDFYLIEVIDDGIGFHVNKNNEGQRKGGIGLVNLRLRLKQLFGSELQVTSEVGKGTTVSFQVPKENKR